MDTHLSEKPIVFYIPFPMVLMIKNIRLQKGQSLFELIMAVGLVSLVLVALMGLASKSVSNATFSRNKSLAARYNQEALEWLRGQRDAGWDNFVNNDVKNSGGNESVWCLRSLDFSLRQACGVGDEIQDTNFLRQATLTYLPGTPPSVNVLVVTRWSDSFGTHESRTVTVFTNWRSD